MEHTPGKRRRLFNTPTTTSAVDDCAIAIFMKPLVRMMKTRSVERNNFDITAFLKLNS